MSDILCNRWCPPDFGPEGIIPPFAFAPSIFTDLRDPKNEETIMSLLNFICMNTYFDRLYLVAPLSKEASGWFHLQNLSDPDTSIRLYFAFEGMDSFDLDECELTEKQYGDYAETLGRFYTVVSQLHSLDAFKLTGASLGADIRYSVSELFPTAPDTNS